MNWIGNANEIVQETLNKCRLGICYLAELVDINEHLTEENGIKSFRFRLNPNVLYEAGHDASYCQF